MTNAHAEKERFAIGTLADHVQRCTVLTDYPQAVEVLLRCSHELRQIQHALHVEYSLRREKSLASDSRHE